MENVFFKPWVGENYFENGFNGKKILVLGDSHYCKYYNDCNICCDISRQEECKAGNLTQGAVESFIEYKQGYDFIPYMNTYSKFTNRLFKEEVSNNTTIDFWNSIVFYNYVQKAQKESRISPTQEDYENSYSAFVEILNEYQPDLIIVWGWTLWRIVIKYGIEADFNIIENRKERFYYFDINNKKIPACGIPHPSTSSFTKDWTPYLQEAIKLA